MLRSRKTRSGRSPRDQRLSAELAVGGLLDREALTLKHQTHRLAHRRVVVDDQDLRSAPIGRSSSGQQPVGERRGVERAEVVGSLPDTDEPDGQTELLADGQGRCRPAPTRRSSSDTTPVTSTASVNARAWAIPFCPVCASSTRNVSSTGAAGLLDHALDLRSSSIRGCFVCRRPAVSTSRTSTSRAVAEGDGVERDGAGIGPAVLRDELRAGARAPRPRAARPPPRGTCRPRRGSRSLPSRDEPLGELADRRGLARSVDADHEDHASAGRVEVERAVAGRAPRRSRRADDSTGSPPSGGRPATALHQVGRRRAGRRRP